MVEARSTCRGLGRIFEYCYDYHYEASARLSRHREPFVKRSDLSRLAMLSFTRYSMSERCSRGNRDEELTRRC